MRRHELARLEPGRTLTESRQHLALGTVDADARPHVGHLVVDGHAAADLAHVEARLSAARQEQARRSVHVVPLRLVRAVAVEDLDAMGLAVGDVDPAVGVAADVVGDVELPGIGAGLPPRPQQRPFRPLLLDPPLPIPVAYLKTTL